MVEMRRWFKTVKMGRQNRKCRERRGVGVGGSRERGGSMKE